MKISRRKKLFIFFLLPALLCLSLFLCDYIIKIRTSRYLYDDPENLPHHKVGLLLGTSKYLKNGRRNLFFEYRIKAAVKLWKAKKIEYIIASGDNRAASYNEPKIMRQELLKRGIPFRRIYLDYAGFRTLDSVVRCRKVFGQDSFVVISQKFHNERAVFIARNYGIRAVGFNSRAVPKNTGQKTKIREYFARVKAVIDIYITGEEPRYLGEKIIIR